MLVGGIVDRRVEVILEKRRVRIGFGSGVSYRHLVRLFPDLLEAKDVGVGGRDRFRDVRAACRLEWDEGAGQGDVECVDGNVYGLAGFAAAFAATGYQSENTQND